MASTCSRSARVRATLRGDGPPATTASAVRRRFPASFHQPFSVCSAGVAPAGRETHWRSPGAVVGGPGHRRRGRRRWRYHHRTVCPGSARCFPGRRSRAGRSGPAAAPRVCCDSAESAPACTDSARWDRPCSRRGRGSSPPPVESAPGNSPGRGRGKSRYAPIRMVGVNLTHRNQQPQKAPSELGHLLRATLKSGQRWI